MSFLAHYFKDVNGIRLQKGKTSVLNAGEHALGAGLELMLAKNCADSLPEQHVYGHCDQHQPQHLVTSTG